MRINETRNQIRKTRSKLKKVRDPIVCIKKSSVSRGL